MSEVNQSARERFAVYKEFARIKLYVYFPEGTNVISCHKQLEFLSLPYTVEGSVSPSPRPGN